MVALSPGRQFPHPDPIRDRRLEGENHRLQEITVALGPTASIHMRPKVIILIHTYLPTGYSVFFLFCFFRIVVRPLFGNDGVRVKLRNWAQQDLALIFNLLLLLTDKRNSTGNLYFTDALADHPISASGGNCGPGTLAAQKAAGGARHGSQPAVGAGNSSCTGSMTSIESTATLGNSSNDMAMTVSKELRTAAGMYATTGNFLLDTPRFLKNSK